MWIYPQYISALRDAFRRYRVGSLDYESLQITLSQYADCIVALEEKWLRRYLLNAEGHLELARFILSEENAAHAASEILAEIERTFEEHEACDGDHRAAIERMNALCKKLGLI